MTEALISASQVHETAAIHIFDNANTLYNLMLTATPNNRNQVSHRQLCNAAQALKDLDRRKNSVFSDRLAILANLCNYEKGFGTMAIELGGYGFSTYVLTVAILKGDTSLLRGYHGACQPIHVPFNNAVRSSSFPVDHRNNGVNYYFCESPSSAYGFSWGPDPMGRLTTIKYLEEPNN